ncbi:hypothetical protein [Lysinibacillus piscis]|uniref:XkdX family protein n=1 Tax=Lysinibacillus piscis TaxID=2518931 RepID=A0ABQ5NGN4_9BACI|nr:hypothetical protein [Lysinibacillus sp. KH24]GLC87511.1 hypothetical protein LYSBPC_06380 [Lysinibacillus sp. KH24]
MLDEQLLDRLGTYFIYFQIHERFGLTFDEYVTKYQDDAATCSVSQLTIKAATMAVVTA